MNLFQKASICFKALYDEEARFFLMNYFSMNNNMPDEEYLKKKYLYSFGRHLNLNKPQSFNEKLNWLKLNDRKPIYSKLADKYEVKNFVSNVIGDEYVVPNYGVYEKIKDIVWDKIPEQFVLKGTHDSSGAVICRDKSKLDILGITKKYDIILRRNYYYSCREWPYKNIRPRIIIDKFLDDGTGEEGGISLRDYKFWCFNGVPRFMYCTVKDKEIYENFYDMNFNPVNINHGYPRHVPEFAKPKNFDKMVELAGKLAVASNTSFIRVDFFNVNGKIYFGEFTFYDWAGLKPFDDFEQDLMLGEMISLPNKE